MTRDPVNKRKGRSPTRRILKPTKKETAHERIRELSDSTGTKRRKKIFGLRKKMRGVGGPLLCIGDLLGDFAGDGVGDKKESFSGVPYPPISSSSAPPQPTSSTEVLCPSDLPQIFEENYNELTKALKGNDHSWTTLTVKLCAALETADKLVQSADSNVESLALKIQNLESILKRGETAVAMAKDVCNINKKKKGF